jgi:F0F1-type ATP synthase assembly protein I
VTRTRPFTLVVLAILGAGAGVVLQSVLAALGQPKLRPEYTLAITLVFVAAAAIALAVPVRRATRGNPAHRVDPFYATRVVVLAKASALGGALLSGVGLGLVIELILRSGDPGTDAYLRVFSVLGGGIALLVGGLVAEWLCTVPKSGDDHPDVGPAAPAG